MIPTVFSAIVELGYVVERAFEVGDEPVYSCSGFGVHTYFTVWDTAQIDDLADPVKHAERLQALGLT